MRVVFETLWARPDDGWSISSRAYARAMALAGIDVRLLSNRPHGELDPEVLAEVPRRMRLPVTEYFKHDAYVFSTPLGGPRAMAEAETFQKLERCGAPRIFYTMFERLSVQPALAAVMDRLEGVWVPCTANLERLRAAGSTNATRVPYPHFPDDPYLSLPPPRSEPTTFLWVGRWERRKAPHNVLRAFMRAFGPGEAKLILKTNGEHAQDPTYLSVWDTVTTNLGGRWTRAAVAEDVSVITDKLSRRQMVALMGEADVYVSASRGEGLDLSCYFAKLAGRTVVTTDSGGPRDFLGEGDFLVPAKGEYPMEEYAWLWGPGAKVIDYDLGDLVTAMVRARGRTPRRSDMGKFSAKSVAGVFREMFEKWE